MKTAVRRILFLVSLGLGSSLQAQQIDLSLHATATPDSFEVRARSTSGVYTSVPNAVLTLRWELTSGGVANNSDVRRVCGAYSILNYGGTVDVGAYRYFTLVLFGNRDMGEAGCPIDTGDMVLCTVRIRQLTGCRNVSLVQNAYTGLNNLDYYFSVGGYDVTGDITSAPIAGGDCPPCEPPVIMEAGAGPVPYCGTGVDLWVNASGTAPDYAWYRSGGMLISWLPHVYMVDHALGAYTVIVSNACGADTLEVQAESAPDLCVPPVIDSAWYVPSGTGGGGQGITLHAALSGSCLSGSWILPVGVHVSQGFPNGTIVQNAITGVYTCVVSNACGTDTMELFVNAMDPCADPLVASATVSGTGDPGDPCSWTETQFTGSAAGTGPYLYAWWGPSGSQMSGAPQFSMPHAPWGEYLFVVRNACTSDTVRVLHGQADSTGIPSCMPPEIFSVGPARNVCLNDTVHLYANYVSEGPCSQVQWASGSTILSLEDSFVTALYQADPITLTVTNACGQASVEVPVTVWYAQQLVIKLCLPVVIPLDLDSMMDPAYSYTGGQWSLNDQLHGSHYDPAVDTSGSYYYHLAVDDGRVCPVVEMIILEYPPVYAGEDTTVSVCTSDPPFLLFDMLGGDPMPGGYWLHNYATPNLTFDPSAGPSGEYLYFTTTGQFFSLCSDHAILTIVVDTAGGWFADTDGDGLGDPLDSLWSCDPMEGHVQNTTDECPLVFGTVGDPCDDGNAATHDDRITEACICAGEFSTGVTQVSDAPWRLWPNPAHGDAFFLQVPVAVGRLSVSLHDATGRVVWQGFVSASPDPIEVQLPGGTAAGSYVVRVLAENDRWVQRLVVD